MKKCVSCNKEIDDLYHQCPQCGGETFMQSGSSSDSASWYDSMAKQSEASTLVDKSVKLIMSGKFTEAEKVLKKAIVINPFNATAHSNMGGVFDRQGRFKEAIPWFEKALDLNPHLEGVPQALQKAKDQVNKSKRLERRKNIKGNVERIFNMKCPQCDYLLQEPEFECPKCHYEFEIEKIERAIEGNISPESVSNSNKIKKKSDLSEKDRYKPKKEKSKTIKTSFREKHEKLLMPIFLLFYGIIIAIPTIFLPKTDWAIKNDIEWYGILIGIFLIGVIISFLALPIYGFIKWASNLIKESQWYIILVIVAILFIIIMLIGFAKVFWFQE